MYKTETFLVSAIITLLILLSVTIGFIFHEKKQTSLHTENQSIERIDEYLEKGYRDEAETAILKLSRKELSTASYLRLMKRAWHLTRADGFNSTLFLRVSERAYRSFSSRDDISALYSYALLREGETERAVELMQQKGLDDTEWKALLSEMQLYAEDQGESREPGMIGLDRESGAEAYLEVYEQTGSRGFLQDGILRLLEGGQVERAYALIERENSMDLPAAFRFFAAYDAEKWISALNILECNPQLFPKREQQLLRADIYMRMLRFSEAGKLYENVYSAPESREWISAFNLLYLDLRSDAAVDEQISEEILQDIRSIESSTEQENDDNLRMVLDVAGLLIAFQQAEEADALLSGFTKDASEPEFEILRESAKSTVNPERYSSLLWDLVSIEDSPGYAVHLAWFLVGIEDISGLRELVEFSRNRYGDQAWSDFFHGIVLLYQKQYEQSAEAFLHAYEEEVNWCSAYNSALAYFAVQKTAEALRMLELSELAVSRDRQGYEKAVLEILLKKAEIFIFNGDYKTAGGILDRIGEIDPDNLRAGMYARMLSEERRKND